MPLCHSDKPQQGKGMEPTATLGREPGQDFDPSLLDSIETTARNQLPSDYQRLKFGPHTEELRAVQKLYEDLDLENLTEHATELAWCRHFAWLVRHEDTGLVKVVANACHLRWCPVCAQVKRMVIKTAVSKWLRTVKRPKFMTFTVKHSTEPLDDQIRRLYKGYRLFRQHKLLKKKQRGGVWFFQIKRSKKSGEWHPHLHVVADMDYVNKVEIQDEWLLVTGDSYVVDIRAIKDPGKVVDYVARYCATPCRLSDNTPEDRLAIANTLHGKRLCGRFGSGNKCIFKPQRPVDFAKWERIITWSDCILNRKIDTRLAEVIKAWSRGTPLDSTTASDISNTYAPTTLFKITFQEKVLEPQLYFEEFS